jgi:hypothetical protein
VRRGAALCGAVEGVKPADEETGAAFSPEVALMFLWQIASSFREFIICQIKAIKLR